MKNEILDKIYGNTSYNKVSKIEDISFILSFALYIQTVSQNTSDYNNLIAILLSYSMSSVLLKTKYHSKDVQEIKKTYNEFIKEYDKLNKIFDLKNPNEIYQMFDYLLYKGYLSVNKDYKYEVIDRRQIFPLKGAEIFTGRSRCDNTSYMLNDILKENGNNSDFVVVNCPTKVTIDMGDFIINNRKQLLKVIEEYSKDGEHSSKEIEELISFVKYFEKESQIRKLIDSIYGSHAINIAEYNNKCYILDTTNRSLLKYNKDTNMICYDYIDDISIKYRGSKLIYGTKKKNIDNKIILPGTTIEEDTLDLQRVNNICNNNIDIFDKFYNDNKDMYEDTSIKVLKLLDKKKRR